MKAFSLRRKVSVEAKASVQGVTFVLAISLAAALTSSIADDRSDRNATTGSGNNLISPRYAVIDLGTNFFPTGINNNGVVVGNTGSFYGPQMWSTGTVTLITTDTNGTYRAVGIDDAGHILGKLLTGTPPPTNYPDEFAGCYWASASSTPQVLGETLSLQATFGDLNYSEPVAISSQGFMIGNDENVQVTQFSPTFINSYGLNYSQELPFDTSSHPTAGWWNLAVAASGTNQWCGSYFWSQSVSGVYTYGSGPIVNGTPYTDPAYTNLFLRSINQSNWVVGGLGTNTAIMAVPGSSGSMAVTNLGPGWATGINDMTTTNVVGTTTTVSYTPQIIGYDCNMDYGDSGNGMLWDQTYGNGLPTTNGIYVGKNLNSLIPHDSGWLLQWQYPTYINPAIAINNSGAIVGTANYTPQGTNDTTPAGPHGVMLLPVEFVREVPPGSGNFEPIVDNGLDDNATLPVYATESGTGKAMSYTTAVYFEAQLSQDLSNNSRASMTVNFQNNSGAFNGTVTETAAGSGVFVDSNNAFTLTLSPTTQTTSPSTVDSLQVQVTDSSLVLQNTPFILLENSASSDAFTSPSITSVVVLPGTLSTTSTNTIQLTLFASTASTSFITTLVETAVNSRIFKDTSGTTLTMSNFTGGTNMNVLISASSFLPVSTFTSTLTVTSTTSLQYVNSNLQKISGDVMVNSPSTDGEGIFYVQFPGSTATSITLLNGNNSVTTTALPLSSQPNMLRTGKLALINAGDPFSGSGITTLAVSPGYNIQLQMYGRTIVDPGKANNAFIGGCLTPDLPKPEPHLDNIREAVVELLGWNCPEVNERMTKADVLAAVPTHNLWYSDSHGETATKTGPMLAFECWNSPNTNDFTTQPIQPPNIAGINTTTDANGKKVPNVYKLVFIDSCLSADGGAGSLAFVKAFNAKAYVGWDKTQDSGVIDAASPIFFAALAEGKKVRDGLNTVNQTIQSLPNVKKISSANLVNLPASGKGQGLDEVIDIQ